MYLTPSLLQIVPGTMKGLLQRGEYTKNYMYHATAEVLNGSHDTWQEE